MVNAIPDFPAVVVQFADWSVRRIDMAEFMNADNPGVFAHLRDPNYFNQVRVLEGTMSWPGELDMDSEAVYLDSH